MVDLSEREMELLALVAFQELPGREVAQRYKAETGRSISYGTLYSTFRRLRKEKLVDVREDQDEDGRLKFFKITEDGVRAVNAARQNHNRLAGFGLAWKGAV